MKKKKNYILIRQRILEHRRHSSASPLSIRPPAALHMKIKYSQNLRFYQLHLYSTVIIFSCAHSNFNTGRFILHDISHDSFFTIFLSNSSNILTLYCSPYIVKLLGRKKMLNAKSLIGDRLVILPSLLRPLFLSSRPPASLHPRTSRDNIRKDIIIRNMDLLLPFF
jgi:hypothetical protein